MCRFSAARFLPGGGGQGAGFAGFHGGQSRQDVGEVSTDVDFQTTAVFYDGVEDRAFTPRFFVSYKQPVFLTKFGRTDRVFDEVVINLNQTFGEVDFESLPLVQGVGDGFTQFGAREDLAGAEFEDGFVQALVDHSAFGTADCHSLGGACFGLSKSFFDLIEEGDLMKDPADEFGRLFEGFEKFPSHVGMAAAEFEPTTFGGSRSIDLVAVALDDGGEFFDFFFAEISRVFRVFGKECVEACGVPPWVPMEKDAAARDVGCPEVADLCFAGAGFEVSDGSFVKLSVSPSMMFGLDFSIDEVKPVGTEQGPVAEGLAVEVHSQGVKHFYLSIVGKMENEAVVDDFRDESGAGDAAFLQAGLQGGDDGWGGGVVDADVFDAGDLQAVKFGAFELKLLGDFFTDATIGFGFELNFERDDFLAFDWKVIGDARGTGFAFLLAGFGEVDGQGWSGGGWLACWGVVEKIKETLSGIELFAACSEDFAI